MTEWITVAAQYEAELDVARNKLHKLEAFFKEVSFLTANHDAIRATNGNVYASVSPKKLGESLAKVDENWKV
jgi:hypothetical protein